MTETEIDPLVSAVTELKARMPHILSEHSDFEASLKDFATRLGQSDMDVLGRAIEDKDPEKVASALGMSPEELQERSTQLYEQVQRVSLDFPELLDAAEVLRGLVDSSPRQ